MTFRFRYIDLQYDQHDLRKTIWFKDEFDVDLDQLKDWKNGPALIHKYVSMLVHKLMPASARGDECVYAAEDGEQLIQLAMLCGPKRFAESINIMYFEAECQGWTYYSGAECYGGKWRWGCAPFQFAKRRWLKKFEDL